MGEKEVHGNGDVLWRRTQQWKEEDEVARVKIKRKVNPVYNGEVKDLQPQDINDKGRC